MDAVRSADGTWIAYERQGEGPALIVVDGALCNHASNSKSRLMALLAPHLTVYCYDRRGRGESTDTRPYAVAREIEDLEAVIDQAGGAASVYGHSSGACLAMEAAVVLRRKIEKLAMYEAPWNNAPGVQSAWSAYLREMTEALATGRRGDAVAAFMAYVGTPAAQIEGMRQAPFWAGLEAIAPTLAYDHAGVMGENPAVPTMTAARVLVPTLVMYGTASLPFMPDTARALSEAIPHAQLQGFDGQRHDVDPGVLAPALVAFLTE